MADKQQNILINLKFNTAELEKGTNLVNRANEATNKLQQSSDQAGKKIGDAYRAPQQSILAMQNQLARLKSQIEVSSNPQKVQQLSAEYKKLKAELDKATKAAYEQAKAVKNLSDQSKGLGQTLGNVGTVVQGVFSAILVRQIVDTSLSLAKLEGNAEGVGRAFNRAFPNAIFLLEDLRKATHGTLTEFELMQRTLLATNLGVSVEGLPRIFEFVATRVQQTGQNLDVLLDKFIRGIGVKSPRLLDDLGISSIRLREKLDGVALSAVSIGDFTKIVSEIAEEELGKMGGYAETAATKVDQISVAFQNLRLETAQAAKGTNNFILETIRLAIEGARVLVQIRGNVLNFGKQILENEQKLLAMQDAERVRAIASSAQFLNDEQKRFDFVQQEINTRVQTLNTYEAEKRANQERIEQLNKVIHGELTLLESAKLFNREQEVSKEGVSTIGTLRGKDLVLRSEITKQASKELYFTEKQGVALESNSKIIKNTIDLLKQYLDTTVSTNERQIEQTGIIERIRGEIEALQEAIEKTNQLSDLTASGALIKQLEKAQDELDRLLGKGKDKQKQFAKEVQEYLAYLSDLELFQTKKMLEQKVQARQDAAERERENEKRSHELREYFRDLEARKIQEAEDEKIRIEEEAAIRRKEIREEITNTGIDIATDQLISFEDAEVASLQNRLNNLRNFYDEQQLLAGDNDRAKQALRLKEERETAELQKKIAQKQKEARRFSVIIDTAAGIARAFATAPNIAVAIVQAALVAAQGASQLAIINRTQARFAKGVIDLKGPGTGTSDSIPARLSKGESVMTAKETRGSMGILKDIRAKKLNDNVLQNLKLTNEGVRNVGMDDSRLLKKLDEIKNSQPNIIEQSGRIYKQFTKGKDYKRKVRIKNLGY
jgi:DNA repair exonuclease SbcCD ATPase subunit